MDFHTCKQTLLTAVSRWPVERPDEYREAAMLLFGGPPPDEHLADFLDFLALEWVDADGWTLAARLAADGILPAQAAAWDATVRTALWVVDGWKGDLALLRDLATDDEFAVLAPGLQPQLPKRMVLRARLLFWDGAARFSGDPDLVESMGVLARLDLLRQWQQTPEPALLARLAEVRALYRRMRAERAAWIATFGADFLQCSGPGDLSDRLTTFFQQHARNHPGDSDAPEIVKLEISGVLAQPGRHAVLYDAVEGLLFFPSFGELCDHVAGRAAYPEILREYIEDPALSGEALRRAGMASGKERRRWEVHVLPG